MYCGDCNETKAAYLDTFQALHGQGKTTKTQKKNALVSSQYASPSNAARDRAAAVTQATTTTTGSGLATNDNPPLIECRLGAYTRSFTVDFPCPSRGNC